MYYFVIFLDIRKMQIMILGSCCDIQMLRKTWFETDDEIMSCFGL